MPAVEEPVASTTLRKDSCGSNGSVTDRGQIVGEQSGPNLEQLGLDCAMVPAAIRPSHCNDLLQDAFGFVGRDDVPFASAAGGKPLANFGRRTTTIGIAMEWVKKNLSRPFGAFGDEAGQ